MGDLPGRNTGMRRAVDQGPASCVEKNVMPGDYVNVSEVSRRDPSLANLLEELRRTVTSSPTFEADDPDGSRG